MEGSPDHTSVLTSGSRQRAVESYIFGIQPRVLRGHHQRGVETARCKGPGSGVEGGEGTTVKEGVESV